MKHLLTVSLALFSYLSSGQAPKPGSPPAVQAGLDAASRELVTLTKAWTDAMNAKDHEHPNSCLCWHPQARVPAILTLDKSRGQTNERFGRRLDARTEI